MAEGPIRRIFGEIFLKDGASKTLGKVDSGMDQAKESAIGLQGVISALGGAAVLSVYKSLVSESIKVAAAFEQTTIAFEVMLGSADGAAKLLNEIGDMSLVTPFTPEQLEKNAKLMLNFGATAEEIIPSLQMLGDISGGNAVKMDALSLAFSQVKSQGKLMGQDLLQMINAGFNPLLVLSEKTGKSMAVLKKEMSAGKIAFKDVKMAMEIATGEGGRFNKMMEKQSKTWNGMISTMEGFKGETFKQIGKIFMRWFKPILQFIVELTQSFVEFIKTERGAAILETALIALSVAVGVILVAAFKALAVAAWAALVPLAPFILIALAIIAAITTVVLVIEDLIVGFQGGESVLFDFFKLLVKVHFFIVRKLENGLQAIIDGFWMIVDASKMVGLAIADFFMAPILMLIDFFNDFVDFMVSLPGRIVNFFAELGDTITTFFEGLLPEWAIKLLNRATGSPAPASAAIEGRQSGGPVTANTPFVVGEDGPELFVPSQSGSIVPNGGMKGSKSVVIQSVVGTLNVIVNSATEAAEEIEAVILDALNNLAENTLAAEMGVELT